jgi:hypothetical protein
MSISGLAKSRREVFKGAAALAGGLILSATTATRPALAAPPPAGKLSDPLPDPIVKGFHVWDVRPIDYVAEEFLMSGESPIWEPTSVLDMPGNISASKAPFNYLQHTPNSDPRQVLGAGPYITRVVVYRPRDMSKFSGVSVVEFIHTEDDGYLYVFNVLSRFYASRGIAVVAIQHPENFAATAKADPSRYGSLAVKDFTQLWGTVQQVGSLLKSSASPLRARTKRLYLTGYSLTGMCTSTFANFFHDQTRDTDGKPIFDGYLPHGNEFYIKPLDVPVIRVNSQGDFDYFTNPSYNPFARVPDSDDSWHRTRRYEVAGAQHAPLPAPEEGAAVPPFWKSRSDTGCYAKYPAGAKLNDMIFFRPVYEIAVAHMEEWITKGKSPPRAPWIAIGKDTMHAQMDENGNAVGGLRMPDIQLPVATYGVGDDACRLDGYIVPFPVEKLKGLYSSKANYLRLYDEATDRMVSQRWILSDAARRLKRHARDVPEF